MIMAVSQTSQIQKEVNCPYAQMNAGIQVTAPIMLNVSFSPSMLYLQGKSPGGWVGLQTLPLPEIKP